MLFLEINRNEKMSISKQICRSIKNAILDGKITEESKLPSTRELANELQVARNTVIESYEQLIAEGYAVTKKGAGTFVCKGVAILGRGFETKDYIEEDDSHEWICSFRTGIPDLCTIPIKKWGQIYHQITMDMYPEQMDYQSASGELTLRTELSRYLNRIRGTKTKPENILITNGAAQAFSLLCGLVAENEFVLVEDPLSYGLLHTLESCRLKMSPIALDKNGMRTSRLPDKPPKLIFTTPSHQFPTGVVLTASRRADLIRYADQNNAYIVEDDYDSEFRYDGSPVEAMQCLAPDRVIYVGTFSKTFMPALRMGYMVLPEELLEKIKSLKYVSDIHSSITEQLTMAKYIESGALERHIRKMKKQYEKKRNYLIKCITAEFGDEVTIRGEAAGLHFICAFQNTVFTQELLQEIEQAGIEISAVNKHMLSGNENTTYHNCLIFGFGNTPIEKMRQGICKLAKVIKR